MKTRAKGSSRRKCCTTGGVNLNYTSGTRERRGVEREGGLGGEVAGTFLGGSRERGGDDSLVGGEKGSLVVEEGNNAGSRGHIETGERATARKQVKGEVKGGVRGKKQ